MQRMLLARIFILKPQVLIADGNYPASSAIGPNAELVSLNLMPGVVTCTQVLQAILSAIPSCTLMFKQELPLMFPDCAETAAVRDAMFDPFEYLMARHRDGLLRTDFKQPLGKVSYHVPCHGRVQKIGKKTDEMFKLIGKTVSVQLNTVERCSGRGCAASGFAVWKPTAAPYTDGKATKSRAGERTLALPMSAVAVLRRRFMTGARLDQPVFPDINGGFRDPANVRRELRARTRVPIIMLPARDAEIYTVVGLEGVAPAAVDAAKGMGMTSAQRLFWVELPLAFPVILTGIGLPVGVRLVLSRPGGQLAVQTGVIATTLPPATLPTAVNCCCAPTAMVAGLGVTVMVASGAADGPVTTGTVPTARSPRSPSTWACTSRKS